ncbi:MAG: type II toxin-antitoxin system VapC family toxin [Parvularculaceae bacterium]
MTIVIDASIAAAFVLPDEQSDIADKALRYLISDVGFVPSLFWHEIRGLLVASERRRRISADEIAVFLVQLRSLAVHDSGAGDDHEVLRLSRAHGLTAYDAAYLALALWERAPLATTDKNLRAAAAREGAALFQ